MRIIVFLIMFYSGVVMAQVTPAIPSGTVLGNATSGLAPPTAQRILTQNICTQPGVPCYGDTMWVNESSMSCQGLSGAGTTAVISGMTSNGENLTLSPYVGAQAVVTGCGPAAATNSVGGITVAGGGTGYASSPAPVAGDYIVVGGGTAVNGSTFTGVLASGGIITVTGITGQLYLGTVITGSGVPTGVIIQDFISGTGGNGTYQTTYTGGGIGSESMTGTNRTVIRVQTQSTGVITAASIVAGGQYSTPPSAPQSQSGTGGGTSGSGSGATFTLTYAGLPINGQIASVTTSGFTFVPGVNAITPYTGKSEQVAAGHFDDSATTATLATNTVAMFFPNTQEPAWVNAPLGYGFQNPITLPNMYRFSLLCQGTRIIALSPLNSQLTVAFQSNTTLYYKSVIDNCDLQGMGEANYNVYLSAARWIFKHSSAENAAIENIFIGDSAGDNAANDDIDGVRVHNDTNAIPAWPAYNYELQASADNTVIGLNGDTAMWGGALINGADDQWAGTNNHLFGFAAGPGIDIEATKAGISLIVDKPGPGQACYYLNGSLTNVHNGWQCSLDNTYLGQYGIYINNDQRDTIGCGTGANNIAWSSNYTKLVYFGVAQVTTRVLPCTGNGGSDPAQFLGPTTVNGNVQINGNLAVTGSAPGSSAAFGQSGVPFILVNGCTVSTTGALTSCTSLPQVYPQGLMYFPQGTLQTTPATQGYTAGFYYVNMSSQTAGQACLNGATTSAPGYVSGNPVAVLSGSCTPPTNAVNSTFTAGTGAITGPVWTYPANTLEQNGRLEWDIAVSNDSNANAHTTMLSMVDGSSNTFTATNNAPTTATYSQSLWRVQAAGYTHKEVGYLTTITNGTGYTLQAGSPTNRSTATLDTTTNITLSITMTLTAASSTDMVLESYSIKSYPSN